MQGIWGKQGIRQGVIRGVFQSYVQGALLSGLETEVLLDGEIRRMESLQCALARRAMGSRGSRAYGQMRRQITDREVREWMGIATVRTELRARRLKWWGDMLACPAEYGQLRAALFGTMAGILPILNRFIGVRSTELNMGTSR